MVCSGGDYFLSYEEIKSRIPSDLGSFEIVEVDEFQSNNRVAFYEKSMDFASSFEGAENALQVMEKWFGILNLLVSNERKSGWNRNLF